MAQQPAARLAQWSGSDSQTTLLALADPVEPVVFAGRGSPRGLVCLVLVAHWFALLQLMQVEAAVWSRSSCLFLSFAQCPPYHPRCLSSVSVSV